MQATSELNTSITALPSQSPGSTRQGRTRVLVTSFPLVPGHEVVAEVVAVPDSEKRWKIGDWVGGAWHGGHCGKNYRVLQTQLHPLTI